MPSDLLVIRYYQVIHVITDAFPGNIQKDWLCTVPKFNTGSFPFIICSGVKTYNLVNVKTGRMSILIEGSAFGMGG